MKVVLIHFIYAALNKNFDRSYPVFYASTPSMLESLPYDISCTLYNFHGLIKASQSVKKWYADIEKSSQRCYVIGNGNRSFWNCLYNFNRFTILGRCTKVCQQEFWFLVQIRVEKAPNCILQNKSLVIFQQCGLAGSGERSLSKLNNIYK